MQQSEISRGEVGMAAQSIVFKRFSAVLEQLRIFLVYKRALEFIKTIIPWCKGGSHKFIALSSNILKTFEAALTEINLRQFSDSRFGV